MSLLFFLPFSECVTVEFGRGEFIVMMLAGVILSVVLCSLY
jgi:hypothetical protein